jgi:biotin transport system substrate-specific component
MEKNVVMIALFAALIAVLGMIPPISLAIGVPITAQSMGVMLAGMVLGAKRGALSVLLFLALVALGLPLLSGGRGGLGVFAGPTSGFLFGWVVGAFVTGLIVEKVRSMPVAATAFVGAFVGCIVVLYLIGVIGMTIVLDKPFAAMAGAMLVYIPGDLIKAGIAAALTAALAKARPASVLSLS